MERDCHLLIKVISYDIDLFFSYVGHDGMCYRVLIDDYDTDCRMLRVLGMPARVSTLGVTPHIPSIHPSLSKWI